MPIVDLSVTVARKNEGECCESHLAREYASRVKVAYLNYSTNRVVHPCVAFSSASSQTTFGSTSDHLFREQGSKEVKLRPVHDRELFDGHATILKSLFTIANRCKLDRLVFAYSKSDLSRTVR